MWLVSSFLNPYWFHTWMGISHDTNCLPVSIQHLVDLYGTSFKKFSILYLWKLQSFLWSLFSTLKIDSVFEYSVKDIRRALSTVFVSDACLSLSFPNRWHKHSSFAYEFTVFSNILNCMYSESLNQWCQISCPITILSRIMAIRWLMQVIQIKIQKRNNFSIRAYTGVS